MHGNIIHDNVIHDNIIHGNTIHDNISIPVAFRKQDCPYLQFTEFYIDADR